MVKAGRFGELRAPGGTGLEGNADADTCRLGAHCQAASGSSVGTCDVASMAIAGT